MAVDVKSYWRILVDEVLNPFYLFEIFSVVVWTVDDYIYYAGCVFAVSVISMAVALYEIRQVGFTHTLWFVLCQLTVTPSFFYSKVRH